MSEIGLPELPPSQMNVDVWDSEVRGLHQANAAYYTADQMRSYGMAFARAALERAAKICDGLTVALDNGGNEYRREANASRCAAAIRAEIERD